MWLRRRRSLALKLALKFELYEPPTNRFLPLRVPYFRHLFATTSERHQKQSRGVLRKNVVFLLETITYFFIFIYKYFINISDNLTKWQRGSFECLSILIYRLLEFLKQCGKRQGFIINEPSLEQFII